MPVQSEKQRRFMYASLAGKTDVPPSVAEKFVGPKAHSQGGALKESEMAESKRMIGKELAFMKANKAPKKMIEHEKKEAKGYASGGGIRGAKTVTKTGTPQEEFSPNYRTPVRAPKLYAKGGGIESRGKTKGKMVKMAYGGKAC